MIAAAADEVSASTAHLFSQHAQDYQALAGQASAFHGQFVQHLTAGAASYTNIEAFITSFLHDLNASVDPFVNFIKSTPPNVLLGTLFLLLRQYSFLQSGSQWRLRLQYLFWHCLYFMYIHIIIFWNTGFFCMTFITAAIKVRLYIYIILYFTENGYYF